MEALNYRLVGMKTVKKNKSIMRVSDKDAENLIKEKGWKYCPKSEWKEKVRDKNDVLAEVPEIKKNKKKKKMFIKVDDAGVNLDTGKFNG